MQRYHKKKIYIKNCNEKHTRKWDKVEKSPLPNSRFLLQVEQKEKTKAMKNFKCFYSYSFGACEGAIKKYMQ